MSDANLLIACILAAAIRHSTRLWASHHEYTIPTHPQLMPRYYAAGLS